MAKQNGLGQKRGIRVGDDIEVPQHLHQLLADWQRWKSLVMAAARMIGDGEAPTTSPDGWGLPVCPGKLICVSWANQWGPGAPPEFLA